MCIHAFAPHSCTPKTLLARLTPTHMEGTTTMAPLTDGSLRCVECVVPHARGLTADTVCGRAQARIREGGWVPGVRSSLVTSMERQEQAWGAARAVVQ